MKMNVLEDIPVLLSQTICCERRLKMASIHRPVPQSALKIRWNMLANDSHNSLGLVL